MIYLTGVTSDRDEPALIAAGIGLMVQPGNSYHLRVDRYPSWAADNGCFEPATYIGHDRWLAWLDKLPRDGCLFAVVPDVARRADGSLGGDVDATWDLFCEYGELVRDMGFPAALAAQNDFEKSERCVEMISACDVLFVAGNDDWKLGPGPVELVPLARSMGKWVHMGRVNSRKRLRFHARDIGCNSADGTFIKYRRRKRAGEGEAPESRGVAEIAAWLRELDDHQPLLTFETPSHPNHRDAAS